MEAATALNRALDRSIQGPATEVVTAVWKVSAMPGDFDPLI